MTVGDIEFLALAIGTITVFGGVLAWATWMEGRAARRAPQQVQAETETLRRAA